MMLGQSGYHFWVRNMNVLLFSPKTVLLRIVITDARISNQTNHGGFEL